MTATRRHYVIDASGEKSMLSAFVTNDTDFAEIVDLTISAYVGFAQSTTPNNPVVVAYQHDALLVQVLATSALTRRCLAIRERILAGGLSAPELQVEQLGLPSSAIFVVSQYNRAD